MTPTDQIAEWLRLANTPWLEPECAAALRAAAALCKAQQDELASQKATIINLGTRASTAEMAADVMQAQLTAQAERIAALEEALRPMAMWVKHLPASHIYSDGDGGLQSYKANDGTWVSSPTVGDCRRAAELLKEKPADGMPSSV